MDARLCTQIMPPARREPCPPLLTRTKMPETRTAERQQTISRDQLADLLNEDLAREHQAIIAYVVCSQVLKGAAYMSIA